MKKKVISLIFAMVCIMVFAGCSNNSEPQSPNVKVPTIMYDGQLYSTTSEKVIVEIGEHDYLGVVDSEVAISEWPQIDGQTNHAPYLDAPYTIFEDKFIILVNGEWIYCKLREVTQQDDFSLSLGTYVFEKSIDDIVKPHITLEKEQKSSFIFTAVTKTLNGTYEINEDELIMKMDDDKFVYCFNIVDKSLVFNGEKSSTELWGTGIVDGSVFELEN